MLISPSRVPNELDDSGEVCREYTLWNEEERGRWREGGLSTARKGVGNPFGLCVGRGSIPRRALSLVFKVGEERRWFRGTRSTTRTGENSGAGRFHSAPVSACKINEFDRVWGKVGSEAREATVRLTREGSRVTAVVHTGSHVRDPNNCVIWSRAIELAP